MAEYKNLDNMAGQDIKALIINNEITIEQLDSSALNKLMDFETDMLFFGKGDIGLITKCSELLDSLEGNSISDEEFGNIIKHTKAEHIAISDEKNEQDAPKRRITLKRVLLIAAILAIIITGTLAIVGGYGVKDHEYLNYVSRQPIGTVIHVENCTFYHGGPPKTYSSAEELMEKENIRIMYPTKFPEDVVANGVEMHLDYRGEKQVSFSTDDIRVGVSIQLSIPKPNYKSPKTYCFNGRTYYIEYRGRFNQHCAFCYYNNNAYSITARTEEELILIIKSMKE